MFRLLPWSSTLGGLSLNQDNDNNQSSPMLATPPSCASSGVPFADSLSLPKHPLLKRKRSPSPGADSPVARFRPDNQNHASSAAVAPLSPSSQPSPSTPSSLPLPQPDQQSSPVASLPKRPHADKVKETLEAQLSLEVLLKHNELRFIDQEIAKCQVALEQLRRCSEIPYPGSHVAGLSSSLSNGTGSVVCPPGNGPVPPSPAPWGVTDGPYSRHYAKWLLPDPQFDQGHFFTGPPGSSAAAASATSVSGMTTDIGLQSVEGRSTRANPSDYGALAGKTRPQRGSGSGSKLQALPNGYPAPKERAGPMIIRRKSDGVAVKLVCLDCRRDNFSSTQGFINHCRIAHNRNFASHDAAAVASGEPVQVDEAGAVVGGSKTETSSGPAAAPGYVHPLVRSAHAIDSSQPSSTAAATAATAATAAQSVATPRKPSGSGHDSIPSTVETPCNATLGKRRTANKTSSSFLASPDTPHLSSLMQHQGVGVDLSQLVGEAKATVDLGAYSSANEDDGDSDDDDEHPTSQSTAGTSEVRTGRQPVRTVGESSSTRRPDSHNTRKPKSLESLAPVQPGASYISPYGSSANPEEHVDGMDIVNLSPNTVESNQAPSLVSDYDDDDDGEAASDSESPISGSSDAEDDAADRAFSHIDVEDDDNDAATTSATATAAEPKGGGPPGLKNPAPPALSKPLRRGHTARTPKRDQFLSSSSTLNGGKEEKHVSFVSPESPSSKGKGHDQE